MFLILVVGENSLESRQLGYCEGGKISRVGEDIPGHLSPGREAIWGGETYCYTGIRKKMKGYFLGTPTYFLGNCFL